MEIPLPKSEQNQDDIFKYGFDGSLNRPSNAPVMESNVEKAVQDVLANSGINLNTTLTPSSGGSGNFERNDFLWSTIFEAIVGYGATRATCLEGGVYMSTTNVINNFAGLTKDIFYSIIPMTWDKNRKLRCVVQFNSTYDKLSVVGMGDVNLAENFLGFKISGIYLYAYSRNTLGSQEINLGVVTTQPRQLEVRHIAGVRDDFYVNNEYKCSMSDYMPVGTTNAKSILTTRLTTLETEIQGFTLAFWELWQAN